MSLPRAVALVTGASSGIGRSIAAELAARSYDLVLVARDRVALDALNAELCTRHGNALRVTVIAADLSDPASARRVFDATVQQGLAIDVLVNNAGFGVHGTFAKTDLEAELAMVQVQLSTMLALTKLFLAPMRARGRGRILTNSSVYSFSPVPFQAVYSGCKAFLWNFCASLAEELRGEQVTVTVVAPGSTRTAFRKRSGVREKKEGKSGMTAEIVAAEALDAMERGTLLCVPGRWNRMFVWFARRIPAIWVGPFLRRINGVRGVSH